MFNKSFFTTILGATMLLCVVCGCGEKTLKGKYVMIAYNSPNPDESFTLADIKERGLENLYYIDFSENGTCEYVMDDESSSFTYKLDGDKVIVKDNYGDERRGIVSGNQIIMDEESETEINGVQQTVINKVVFELCLNCDVDKGALTGRYSVIRYEAAGEIVTEEEIKEAGSDNLFFLDFLQNERCRWTYAGNEIMVSYKLNGNILTFIDVNKKELKGTVNGNKITMEHESFMDEGVIEKITYEKK